MESSTVLKGFWNNLWKAAIFFITKNQGKENWPFLHSSTTRHLSLERCQKAFQATNLRQQGCHRNETLSHILNFILQSNCLSLRQKTFSNTLCGHDAKFPHLGLHFYVHTPWWFPLLLHEQIMLSLKRSTENNSLTQNSLENKLCTLLCILSKYRLYFSIAILWAKILIKIRSGRTHTEESTETCHSVSHLSNSCFFC